jgi:ABC-type amino acid transport substrate-binding protein
MMRLFFLSLLLCTGLLPAARAVDSGGALASIEESGVIRMGYLESASPFSFDQGGNTPAGYSVDLCKSVADGIRRQLSLPALRIQWVKLDLGHRLAAVRSGQVDVECGTTTWTLSRQEQVDFSLMTFIDGGTVLVRSDSALTRVADLAGKRLAVVPGTTTEKALTGALKQRQLQADVVMVTSPEQALQMLSAGKIDGYASDRVVLLGLGLSSKGAHSFRLLDEDFSVEPYALTLPRGEHDLRLAVNRSLAALFRSGEIEAVFSRWLAPLGKPSVLLSALYYLQGIPE